MPDEDTSRQSSGREVSETSAAESKGGADVQKLADRVYQLMIREIRLDLARSGRVINRRES